jgi:hypothetical protein
MKENAMKKNVGLWIDHREAVIVRLRITTEETMRVTSDTEKHPGHSAGAETNSAGDQRDRKLAGHLHKYYEKVISCIGDADSILILGPGEAKGELRACLQGEAFGGRVVALETVDKMTDRQIVAKVRDHFSEKHSSGHSGSSGNQRPPQMDR